MKKATRVGIGVFLILALWLYVTNTIITTTNINIESKKIPLDFNNFKIAHVSDLHNHDWKNQLINKIEKASPDIIVITGDLVDSSKPDFDIALDFISKVKDLAPIYYVSGNHEAWLSNFESLRLRLEKAGVNMLDDKSLFIEKASSKIQIFGLADPDFKARGRADYIQAALIEEKLGELVNKDLYNILLSHRPEHFLSYVDKEVDLVLSGHAHGGQVRLPFIGGLVAPNQGFFPKYTSGTYSEDQTTMVVSRGLGNSIIPIRFNNPPELVFINLKAR